MQEDYLEMRGKELLIDGIVIAEVTNLDDAMAISDRVSNYVAGTHRQIEKLKARQAEADRFFEHLWDELGDIPVTEDGEELDQDFLHFEKGESKWEVWQWFDRQHSKGVAWLMNVDGQRYGK